MIEMVKYCIIIFMVFLSFCSKGQGLFELGTGFQGSKWVKGEFGGGLRINLNQNNNLHFVGGGKLQVCPISTKTKPIENADDLWNFSLFSGLRYNINICRGKSLNPIGFFPEFRLYLSPLLPRKLSYYENDNIIKLKGESISQLAFGIGCGIYIADLKDNYGYVALRFEFSTVDILESVRELSFEPSPNIFDDTERMQFMISVTLCPPKGLFQKKL